MKKNMKKKERLEREERVIKEYLDGFRLSEISINNDISQHGVQAILKRRKIPKRPTSVGVKNVRAKVLTTDEQKLQIAKDYQDGLSISQISQKYDFNASSVIYWLNKLKIKRRSPPRYSKETIEEAYSLHQQGLKAKEVAKKLNLKIETVRYLWKVKGVGRNPYYLSYAESMKIAEAFMKGKPIKVIAEKFGRSVCAVRRAIEKHGLKFRGNHPAIGIKEHQLRDVYLQYQERQLPRH